MNVLGPEQKKYLHMLAGFVRQRSPWVRMLEREARAQAAFAPCPTDGRRKGRRKYGYRRFPSGDRRTHKVLVLPEE